MLEIYFWKKVIFLGLITNMNKFTLYTKIYLYLYLKTIFLKINSKYDYFHYILIISCIINFISLKASFYELFICYNIT